ncbi:sarcosine oxidase subunit gamma [Roseicyclus marinus]|uniref:sarcosine oxidase subunit gamma n=1 Tax=Roseicyclus marinus TaxID=2161673 RepID=UPI00240F47B5|nr:sarcosine oxidase subunit gamma family protein [Roseicyclus marinus]MDG3041870.1 sarcosine oxidase subunit gamma family protein [Roseicyclus marinus]
MAELIATSPLRDLTPITIGNVTLTEGIPGQVWAVLPWRGATEAASTALQSAHGLPFPAPGNLHKAGSTRIAWAGLDQAFLLGTTPDTALAAHAALIDQSDAWAHLVLSGPATREVLARLVPVDLAPAACPKGSARRTLLGHMSCLILHPGGDTFEILVFRSMASSAVHDLTRAMTAVAARDLRGAQTPG